LVAAPPGIPDLPPQLPMQAVPTSVVQGPDGALYVGQLTGFPFPAGAANVYRVVPGRAPQVYASGFTNIIDIAFDRRGNLYVLEIAKNGLLSGDPAGALYRVSRRGGAPKLVVGEGLDAPGGLAISRWGDIFISNHGVSSGTGEVVRLDYGH
ncbi:MAG: ScyD/ScyE family protein, partial [Thermoleophilaceae bacterium]|nr:ScyD/ScyE family protein [Thermoleophilaceae bacterium]